MRVSSVDGVRFEDGDDWGRVVVFGRETAGRWSLMEFVVSPRAVLGVGATPDFGPHLHREIEETFLVRRGTLSFLLADAVFEMGPGDVVRVQPGARHGFANLTAENVELLVSFHPGGFEELFVKHRTDQHPPPSPSAFIDEATADFASEFGL